MTYPFFAQEITAHPMSSGESASRSDVACLFDDVFLREPAVRDASLVCEPFSNDAPAPSGRTMREPPASNAPKRITLHLPPCRHTAAPIRAAQQTSKLGHAEPDVAKT